MRQETESVGRRRILLLNQAFHPDVVATAQVLADLARELARLGHEVTVIAGRQGYDDPGRVFPARERWEGIRIERVGALALGKASRWRRAVNFASFLVACAVRMVGLPRQDLVVALTSPPLVAFLAALWTRVRGGRYAYWIMDLNPDEALAAGWLRAGGAAERFLSAISAYCLRRAEPVIALDRFMAQRVLAKGVPKERLIVQPPWPHDDRVWYDASGREAFRASHGLADKWVVMYSGNHSPCHPLNTLLEAARRMEGDPGFHFCFVGGGSGWAKARDFRERHCLRNVTLLPYEPAERLSASLSAADLHVVVIGEPFVGLVHPCKIYNIIALGTPFLCIGPPENHVADLAARLGDARVARFARHGDAAAVERAIRESRDAGLAPDPGRGAALLSELSRPAALGRLVAALLGEARVPEVVRPSPAG